MLESGRCEAFPPCLSLWCTLTKSAMFLPLYLIIKLNGSFLLSLLDRLHFIISFKLVKTKGRKIQGQLYHHTLPAHTQLTQILHCDYSSDSTRPFSPLRNWPITFRKQSVAKISLLKLLKTWRLPSRNHATNLSRSWLHDLWKRNSSLFHLY